MRFKILGILAAVALVSACETASEEEMSSSASGTSSSSSASESSSDSGSTADVMENTIMEGSQRDLVVNVGDRVYFGYDRFDLNELSRSTLERQAAWMRKNINTMVTVEGHADERGTREYNLGLSERRANSAKDYLVSFGVNASRIKVVPYGEERPVANGSNEAAYSQNRRAVTTVSSAGS